MSALPEGFDIEQSRWQTWVVVKCLDRTNNPLPAITALQMMVRATDLGVHLTLDEAQSLVDKYDTYIRIPRSERMTGDAC